MAPTETVGQVLSAALLLFLSASPVGGVVLLPNGTLDLTACSCVPSNQCILHPFLPTSDIDFHCPKGGDVCCVPDSIVIGAPACECRISRCADAVAGKCPVPGEFCCDNSPANVPSRFPPASPTEADCTTQGTRFGRCVLYDACRDRLANALSTLPAQEFVNLYGCGRNSDGQFQVCCPLE
ncbi:uncharacterized protein LOC125042598 [Penaeus chinensis]|uniref:uncharacterized protein LOC125042598 n=1 Tax=Penaeus chinensis TaxID=139456 RepID=UPI001FB77584|nr:uncharacterized protein LOC125042598 [Penaeus chinensis]XP_047494302.1 uncharacterized protein LOC125042598 [Penaeus chinensis]